MYCKQCGRKQIEKTAFCPHCGTKREEQTRYPVSEGIAQSVIQQAPEPQKPEKKKGKKKLLTLAACAAVLALAVGILSWIFLPDETETVYVRSVRKAYRANGVNICVDRWEYNNSGLLLSQYRDRGPDIFDSETMEYITEKVDGDIDLLYQYEYDECGNLVSFTAQYDGRELGKSFEGSFEYEGEKAKSFVSYNIGLNGKPADDAQTYSFTYDSDGKLSEVWCREDNEKSIVCRLEYDGEGNLIRKTNAYNGYEKIWEFDYDREGRVTQVITSHITMGSAQEVSKTSYRRFEYSNSGKLARIYDESGNLKVSYRYNEADQLLAIEDRSYEYEFLYDGGKLKQGDRTLQEYVEDAPVIKYAYDDNGCLNEVRYGDGSYVTYEYEQISMTAKEAQVFYWQQQSLPGYYGAENVDWSYLGAAKPWEYLMPNPLDPQLLAQQMIE